MRIDKSIGERLKRWRESVSMTQEEIAKATDVGVRTIASYEAGESLPKTAFLLKIAEMGCDIGHVLHGAPWASQMQSIVSTIDEGLFKQVSEMVHNVQTDHNYFLKRREAEDTIIQYYNDLVQIGRTLADREAQLRAFELIFRRDIQRRAAAAPGSSKASA